MNTISKQPNPLLRLFTFKEVQDIVDANNPVSQGNWRWGRVSNYVVEKDGQHWMVPVRFHVEEGIQDEEVVAHMVTPVTKTITVWERV